SWRTRTVKGSREEERKGTRVVFSSALIRIREVDTQTMEEYTDEWVAAHTDYKTIASFEKAVREKLESDKAVSVNNYYREKAWQALKEKTVFADVQSEILDSYLQESAEYYSLLAEYRGMTLEEVRSEMGYPGEEEFQEYLETSARDRIRDQMLLLSLTRMYGITLSESELNAGKEALVSNLGLSSVESLEGLYDEDTIVETVLMVKAQSELLNHITFLP
ncbi:MAG: hypothetical protein II797_00210, partial [Clostridia bacterium]|nr:hypothetical protein [Clostridia bacterium]